MYSEPCLQNPLCMFDNILHMALHPRNTLSALFQNFPETFSILIKQDFTGADFVITVKHKK